VINYDISADALTLLGASTVTSIDVPGGDGTTLATGDTFVTDSVMRDRLAVRAHLVDMEGFAVVAACTAAGVPVRVAKHVSDAADESAWDWPRAVELSAQALGAWVSAMVRPPDGQDRVAAGDERRPNQTTSGNASTTSTATGRNPRA
jgi:nucleoside phosphorylase